MNGKRNLIAAIVICGMISTDGGVVSNVNVSNRYPWNGLVDIRFTLAQDAAVTVTVTDKIGNTNLTIKTMTANGRMFSNGVTQLGVGDCHIVWNAASDYPNSVFENLEFRVDADEKLYMVVELTKNGGKYPVAYLAGVPQSGWPLEYKTKYLVLRKIPKGTFIMGSPSSEWGRGSNESQSSQTILKDFYIGIYEVSYGQLWKATGYANASHYGWSADYPSDDVGKISDFTTAITSGTGMTCALPTAAQWEYACRAGTTTALYTGKTPSNKYELRIELSGRENFADGGDYEHQIERFGHNVIAVGSLVPNPWGLYDMYGNRGEKCQNGVCKGGSAFSDDTVIRSAYSGTEKPSNHSLDALGFRVVITP